jgi:hypothetical protein
MSHRYWSLFPINRSISIAILAEMSGHNSPVKGGDSDDK